MNGHPFEPKYVPRARLLVHPAESAVSRLAASEGPVMCAGPQRTRPLRKDPAMWPATDGDRAHGTSYRPLYRTGQNFRQRFEKWVEFARSWRRDALTGKPGQQYPFVQVLGIRGLPIVEGIEKRLRTEGRLALDDLPRMGARRDAVANLR